MRVRQFWRVGYLSSFVLLAASVLAGCSNNDDQLAAGAAPVNTAPTDSAVTPPVVPTSPASAPPVAPTPPVATTPPVAITPPTVSPPTDTSPAPTNGVDLSGGDDDSPTAVETLSLQGPFVKDPTRGNGPPSAPTNLTMLLSSENWLRFSWAPSADDQSVEAYEIYRDGGLLYTVRGDTDFEFDYRNWLGTSYMDCDYTHYTHCEGTQPASGNSYEYTVIAVDNEGMKSPPSQAAVFSFQPLQDNPADLSSYDLVFEDEFNQAQLDRDKWKTALPWGPDTIVNSEQQYFVNIHGENQIAYDPFVFTGDTVQITGIRTPSEMLGAANNQPYLSGVLSTRDKFQMTYGYVEMNAKLASGSGLLSTFFLFNQNFERNKPEIDIVEYIGTYPDRYYQAYHHFDSNRARYGDGEKHSSPTLETVASTNLSSDFHTYSALWEPGLVVLYLDGREVRRLAGPRIADEPMNMIVQLVMGSSWIGDPDPGAIPATLEIDYVRAWQKR